MAVTSKGNEQLLAVVSLSCGVGETNCSHLPPSTRNCDTNYKANSGKNYDPKQRRIESLPRKNPKKFLDSPGSIKVKLFITQAWLAF